MRIILFTGKGGVGKTTIAAATALRCADLGKDTLVISTDAAHSLSDSFNIKIGPEVVPLGKHLWAQEIDVNEEIKKNWGPIQSFINQFLRYRGFDSVIADELAVFPGMEEVFSLLQLKNYYVENKFDTIIIDCAPTGDTLRLLAAPDIAKWYMEKIFNIERTIFRAVRPVAQHFVEMPLPTDSVFDSMEGLYKNMIGMKEVLTDQETTSIRIVLNPEKMVIKESQRAYTFLCLFGHSVDGVIINRVLPDEVQDHFYDEWKKIQNNYLREVDSCFKPIPILKANLINQEVIGMKLLAEMAENIYGEKDPTAFFYTEKPMEIKKIDGYYNLLLKLPFARKEDLNMWIKGDELIIRYQNYKRNILLPRTLASLKMEEARLSGDILKIKFAGDTYD